MRYKKYLTVIFILTLLTTSCKKDEGIITANGFIEADTVNISSLITGRIDEITVNEGDEVKEGDLLVILEQDVMESNLTISESEFERLKSTYNSALNLYKQAKLDLDRAKELVKNGNISQSQYDKTKTNYKVALSNLQSAEQALKSAKESISLAKTNLDYTALTSPINGVVDTINYEKGEVITPGIPLITITNPNSKYLHIYINETKISKIKVGSDVSITVDSYPDERFKGVVSFISTQAEFTPRNVQTKEERTTLVYKIKVEMEDPDNLLHIGIPADADIYIKDK